MAGSDGPAPAPAPGPFRRLLASGTWVGSLLCLPFLVVLTYFAARYAHAHAWGLLTGCIVVALVFLAFPVGGLKWLGRVLTSRKPAP